MSTIFFTPIQSEAECCIMGTLLSLGSSRASPAGPRTGQPWAKQTMGHFTWPWANHGPALMGFVRDFTGLALARGYPTVPGVARTNPVRDKSGLANWVVFIWLHRVPHYRSPLTWNFVHNSHFGVKFLTLTCHCLFVQQSRRTHACCKAFHYRKTALLQMTEKFLWEPPERVPYWLCTIGIARVDPGRPDPSSFKHNVPANRG